MLQSSEVTDGTNRDQCAVGGQQSWKPWKVLLNQFTSDQNALASALGQLCSPAKLLQNIHQRPCSLHTTRIRSASEPSSRSHHVLPLCMSCPLLQLQPTKTGCSTSTSMSYSPATDSGRAPVAHDTPPHPQAHKPVSNHSKWVYATAFVTLHPITVRMHHTALQWKPFARHQVTVPSRNHSRNSAAAAGGRV